MQLELSQTPFVGDTFRMCEKDGVDGAGETTLTANTRQYESWRNFLEIVRRDLVRDRRSLAEISSCGGDTAGYEYLVESGEKLVAYAAERLEAAKKRVAEQVGLNYTPKNHT